MQKIIENPAGQNFIQQFDDVSIPQFEENENIKRYCKAIVNSKAYREDKVSFIFQEEPWHEITIVRNTNGCWNDRNEWEIYNTRLRIIHHNGINVIDEINLVKPLFPDGEEPEFFQYRYNNEMEFYEPGIYWKLTDPQMDYNWLEEKLKITAVKFI